jgi:hypothetical protein
VTRARVPRNAQTVAGEEVYLARVLGALSRMGTTASTAIKDRRTNRDLPRQRMRGTAASGNSPSPTSPDEIADHMMASLQANTLLNRRVRASLAVLGLAAGAAALAYTWMNADELVGALAGKAHYTTAELFALTMPFILFVLLAVLAGAAAYTAHARGFEETCRTLEAITRIRREREVAVSARGLIFAFEEKLTNARRAFTLQLWLGRTMFLLCLGLLAVTVINALLKGQAEVTALTGAGSFFTALLTVTKSVPENIAHQLADVIQIQSIVTGCDRQISLLESAAFAALHHDAAGDGQRFALEAQLRIDGVVDQAVRRIEQFADPRGLPDPGAGPQAG